MHVNEASTALVEAVWELTERVTAGASHEQLAQCDWRLLRALSTYQLAALDEGADVLGWVPPLTEIEQADDDERRDKVVQFATWVFTVDDRDLALSAGGGATGATGATVPGVVGDHFEREVDWPDPSAYQRLGLGVQSATFYTQELRDTGLRQP